MTSGELIKNGFDLVNVVAQDVGVGDRSLATLHPHHVVVVFRRASRVARHFLWPDAVAVRTYLHCCVKLLLT